MGSRCETKIQGALWTVFCVTIDVMKAIWRKSAVKSALRLPATNASDTSDYLDALLLCTFGAPGYAEGGLAPWELVPRHAQVHCPPLFCRSSSLVAQADTAHRT